MQPRKRAGPSWADKPDVDSAPKKTVKKVKEVHATSQHEEAGDNESGTSRVGEELSDMEWMRRRMKQGVEELKVEEPPAEKVFEQSDDEEMEDNVNVNPPSDQTAEEKDPTRETISQTSRLFVRNLAFDCTDEELRGLFTPFGEIAQVGRQLYLQFARLLFTHFTVRVRYVYFASWPPATRSESQHIAHLQL